MSYAPKLIHSRGANYAKGRSRGVEDFLRLCCEPASTFKAFNFPMRALDAEKQLVYRYFSNSLHHFID